MPIVAPLPSDGVKALHGEEKRLAVSANRLIAAKDWHAATRHVDRLWRLTRDFRLVGLTYGQLLSRLGEHVDGALMLSRAREFESELVCASNSFALPRILPPPPRGKGFEAWCGNLSPIIDIVIPVYRDLAATIACITSVLAAETSDAEVIVINDASPLPDLSTYLERVSNTNRITLLNNETNLGFVATANRGLGLHADRDVVLLNSDTLVFGNWLSRLRQAAYSASDVATVTPLTNNGTIASYPAGGELHFSGADARKIDEMADASAAPAVAIPVGVGFCLYLRRDALEQIGPLDVLAFGKGYGEETDYCLRARKAGWCSLLAANVFVHHEGARSFGQQSIVLLERAARIVKRRYPAYESMIASFVARDPIKSIRRDLDEKRLLQGGKNFALLVTFTLTGGVDHFTAQRCEQLTSAGLTPLILVPGSTKFPAAELHHSDRSFRDLRYRLPTELNRLCDLLRRLPIGHIELHHFLHHRPEVIEAVRELGVPYDVYIHDYIWICPRVHLTRGNGTYCGEPPLAACEQCVKRHGGDIDEKISVAALRGRSRKWLGSAARVFAPTADTANRIKRYVPSLSISVTPWETIETTRLQPGRNHQRVRVVGVGAIGELKGFDVFRRCAIDAAKRGLDLEFVIIGHTTNDTALFRTGRVFVTGPYAEQEVQKLLAREQADVALFPSLIPETWSFALSHALRAGLPIVAFDLGAIAERLRDDLHAKLLPLKSSAARINDTLLALAADRMNGGPTQINGGTHMTSKVKAPLTVQPTKAKRREPEVEARGINASLQAVNLPQGTYIFRVKTGKPTRVTDGPDLTLPAVHVAPGPGCPPEAVQFLPGSKLHGTWLTQPGDSFSVRITRPAVPIVISSLRGPGGQQLDIAVEPITVKTSDDTPTSTLPVLVTPRSETEKQRPDAVRLQVDAHIRNRGDMRFVGVDWVGRVGKGLWIEGFALTPLDRLGGDEIECKTLTATGFETPWVGNCGFCGTRGMGVPLVGFAIRVKPRDGVGLFDCEYVGFFQSGATVGPIRNGAPCRSTVIGDPLEGIQILIVGREIAAPPPALAKRSSGPHFGKLRKVNGVPPRNARHEPALNKVGA